ncbi:Putative SOS response-associated peptidase YedK [Nitrosospira briensis]|uniref:Abasic site processing protein n=1 Tax=Nitrosospira briensis TaxID=35799 RepID=A0A1I4Z596_9PROT|nr:SOS response-associated peptidase family protein [Nitrosospira briensis]SFN45139.1 Putative SOS response-associated peptidase YedK [Nitrosospira briensis]
MCGRFEQSGTRRHYARVLGADTHGHEWQGGDTVPQYNVSPGSAPLMLHTLNGKLQSDYATWGYRTPAEGAAKRRPWINARVEKALTGRYFRHMFREGRVIIPGGGWFEWTVEGSKKQPWYITRKVEAPIFMAGLTNFRPYTEQDVEVGFVIVTEDCEGGMVDIHDRRPVVLEPEDAWRWMDPDTPVEEAVHIAHTRSLPTEAFTWWRVDRAVNRVDPNNNRRELITPINELTR